MAKKKTFKDYTAWGAISADLVLTNLSFFVFLGILALIYIANTHYSEKRIRQIQQLEAELKQYRWESTDLETTVKYNMKQSEIANDVKELGVAPTKAKPKKIELK